MHLRARVATFAILAPFAGSVKYQQRFVGIDRCQRYGKPGTPRYSFRTCGRYACKDRPNCDAMFCDTAGREKTTGKQDQTLTFMLNAYGGLIPWAPEAILEE